MKNTHQLIYLFAGGRGRKIMDTFSSISEVLQSTGKVKPDVAYIGVASTQDNWLFYFIIATLMKMKCKCRIYHVKIAGRNADLHKARIQVEKADVVFFSGGDVEAGMQILHEKKMSTFFREQADRGKLYIGVSAGSILMSQEWVRWRDPDDDTTAEIFPCLGLVTIICDTHAEKDDWIELKTALTLKPPGTTGFGIISGACLVICPDRHMEAKYGPVAQFQNKDGQIIRRADILPE